MQTDACDLRANAQRGHLEYPGLGLQRQLPLARLLHSRRICLSVSNAAVAAGQHAEDELGHQAAERKKQ